MMCAAIENPSSCKICIIIHFPYPKNMGAAEVHHELCAVYGQNMSEGTVRQWCRMFKDRWRNVHDEGQSDQPSVVSDKLIIFFKVLTETFLKDDTSQFQNFNVDFTNSMHCSLQDYHSLGCHKLCARRLLNMLTGVHVMRRISSALTFFRAIQKWLWISQSHHMSNRWWMLGFICECWNQGTVKVEDARTFTKQAKTV
jgi:hypothetical protein